MMNRLPNFKNAHIDIRKLRDYCLNPNHPVGKHKARIIKAKLGLYQSDASLLKELIFNSLPKTPAQKKYSDKYGTRYTVKVKIRTLYKESVLTTVWIIKFNEDFPRLITCY